MTEEKRIECSICGRRRPGFVHFVHLARGLNANRPSEEIPEMWVCEECMGGAERSAWQRGYLDAVRKADEDAGDLAFVLQRARLRREVPPPAGAGIQWVTEPDPAEVAAAAQRVLEQANTDPGHPIPWRQCTACERLYSPAAFAELALASDPQHRICKKCGAFSAWRSLWPEVPAKEGRLVTG